MQAQFTRTPLAMLIGMALSASAVAQQQDEQASNTDALDFEQIIVTGSARSTTKMDSSVSVSTLSEGDIAVATPRSTAEIFRSIPGIRSESTGGEGNANIAVRGLPVAAGGAKFLVLQEDGLPVMQFGDVAFGNADIFLRADSTVSGIEAVRGGSASTMASNSPGGVINFISKTGDFGGGSVATTVGVDYDSVRTDFEYGGDISDSMRFHIGGFFREGEGPRETGYNGNSGGQIKANITKEFDSGYFRVYFKHLDDKATGYLPMPMYANGDSIAGFDAQSDTPHSAYLQQTVRLNGDNQISRGDMANGMNPQVTSIGFEANFDVSDHWTLVNRFRVSDMKGNFVSPFPAEVASASSVAESIGGSGATLVYANGPSQGTAFTDNTGNGLVMRTHTFDVEMSDFGSYVNDLKLSRDFDNVSLTLGYYKARQDISMSWLWNSYLMEVKGDNAALLNVVGEDGTSYSDNGLYAYGVPYWGNCCQRNYDIRYDIDAPYLALSGEYGDFTWEASVRRDMGDAFGTYAGAAVSSRDMNGDGVISMPETAVAGIDLANASVVNYDWGYTSYSIGGNYRVDEDTAVFARISRGGRANADRLAFGKINADGSVADEDAVDIVDQYEAGVKYRNGGLGLFVTGFYAETEEQNFEATSQRFFDRVYEAKGIEVEAAYNLDALTLKGGFTWTDAEISQDDLNPAVVGNTPRRQADFIYQLTARYQLDMGSIGANLIGTTDAYAQDNNDLEFDGYNQVNVFADYFITDDLTVAVNINNLFDEVGITEAEEGSVAGNDSIIRARTINGRTTSVTLKYRF
ncbi:TonB-dependent receptor [Aestuariibacter halophilus]|uniref:TonB-dependent receptor n=1 Tax=Fluctibacter halophilus TaxID=226011 RepID=A0ABS8GEW8_9ALTE|nr:TonB-dependent receptor [Aestuariibacter halophilus]MCC2617746.1 TonB-dependent receptor [Aestuariibacter halophilus]